MGENIAQEILDELFSSLETLETQSSALLQFLKDKGLASKQDLAPYFEQAATLKQRGTLGDPALAS